MAQYYSDVEEMFVVPKEAFDPEPKVESSVIRCVPKRRFDADEDRKIFRIARAGFAARRKTLANNLSSSFRIPRGEVEGMIVSLGLDTRIRAQELSVGQWTALAEKMA
jgi:16S rRNA (adenine1518-N6/adenine1519-N6)-dimethyltransferase